MTAAPTYPRPSFPRLSMDAATPIPTSSTTTASGPLRYTRAVNAAPIDRTAKHVLLALLEWLDYEGWQTFVGTTAIADACGLHYDTVRDTLKGLQESGVLAVIRPASGRRAATVEVRIEVLEQLGRKPDTLTDQPVGSVPHRPYTTDSPRRVGPTPTLAESVGSVPHRPYGVGSVLSPRRVGPTPTHQGDQENEEAAPRGREAGARRPNPNGSPPQHPLPARTSSADVYAAIPGSNARPAPTLAPKLAATAWGATLIARLREAGLRPRDFAFAQHNPELCLDQVEYIASRAAEVKRETVQGELESETRLATKRAGLVCHLVRQRLEDLDDFERFTETRHKRRAAAVVAVWRWAAGRLEGGDEAFRVEFDEVMRWRDRLGLGGKQEHAPDWSRAFRVIDEDLLAAARGDQARAWKAIVESCREAP